MRESGYAAVTSRMLGKTAGLSPQIVYYYFQTMDALFEAVLLNTTTYYLEAIEVAEQSDEPLIAMWELSADPTRSVLISELMALSNHRKSLKALIRDFSERFLARQARIVEAEFARRGVDLERYPPMTVATILETTARGFAFGGALDLDHYRAVRDFFVAQLRGMLAS